MGLFDVIIVGAGPAGVFAAYKLRPLKVLVLDVGYVANHEKLPPRNIYDLRREGEDSFSGLIGDQFQSLHNIDRSYLSPKLKGPLWDFVIRKPAQMPLDRTDRFKPILSYARGGLANAWGAGVLRFNDIDLEGFPIRAADLEHYYDELTKHIGVNGQADDLSDYLGVTDDLHQPLPLSPNSQDLFLRYQARKGDIRNLGVTIGRTRAAILTKVHRDRPPYQVLGQDFFQPNQKSIYHPGYTLDELIAEGALEYRSGVLATQYAEVDGQVVVRAKELSTDELIEFRGRKLILAAGAINTARIVLRSHDDFSTRLPLLDNPISFIPFVNPARVGSALPVHAFSGGELLSVYRGDAYPSPVQASFYSLGAPLRTDLLLEFPLPLRSSLVACKYLLPALAMLQVFYPDKGCASNFLQLNSDGSLGLSYTSQPVGAVEKVFIRALRRLGFLSSQWLCKYPEPGSSIHYAGCLPMQESPNAWYCTDRYGKLFQGRNVYIADAANFSKLPSKNHTFTIMANAMRIADHVKATVLFERDSAVGSSA
jgi:choline dehydrogenase-like flavoprotein